MADKMTDSEYLEQVGIEIPEQIRFTTRDWMDLYETLSRFKARLMKRHGLDPRDFIHPTTGKLVSFKKSERGS